MLKRFLFITATLIFFCSSAWAQLMNSPWPKIHKDIKNSGYSSNVGTAIGKLKWSFQTEKPITSSPVLDNNNRVYFGSADKNFYCLDRTTGGIIWKFETGDAIEHSSAAIDVNGILYIGSVDKKLYAFDTINIDTSNPKPLWAFTTGAGVYGSPTLADDGTVYFGSADGYIYQIAPSAQAPWPANNLYSDGSKYVWKNYIGIIWSTPTIDSVFDKTGLLTPGLIIGSTKYTQEYGTDTDTGGPCGFKFSKTLKAYNLYVYNLNTKAEIWYGPKNGQTITGIYGSVVLQPDHTVLIPTESDGLFGGSLCWLPVNNPSGPGCVIVPADGDTWCLNSITSGYIKGTPAMIPEGSFFLGHDKILTRFHPSGSEYLSFTTAGNIESSPAVDGNLNTYIGCDGGIFYCFNSNSPEQPLRWRYPETGNLEKLNGDAAEIISSAAIDNDGKHSVYFGASDGKMYAFYDGAAITGKVTTSDGLGLAAVELTLKDTNSTIIATVTTVSDGTFKIPAIATGQYTITPKKDGYIFIPTVASITLTNDIDAYVEFTAQKSFTITGRVVNATDGTALPNVSVGLITKNSSGVTVYTANATTTDSNGYYTFINIGYGITVVTPSLTGWGFEPQSVSQNIPTGTTGGAVYTLANITGTLGYQISGTVIDATNPDDPNNGNNGLGLSGITITLTGTLTSGSAITTLTRTTGSDGTFSFTGLSNGTYTVTPSALGYKFDYTSKEIVINDASVLNLEFQAAKGIKITGIINRSDSSASYDGFSVNLYKNNETIFSKLFNITKARTLVKTSAVSSTGTFMFMGITAGNYIVEPVAEGYGFNPANNYISALTDISGIVFTATSGFSISGQLFNIFGFPQSGIDVTLVGESGTSTVATSGTDGSYTFTGLVAGTYTVSPDQTGFFTTLPISRIVDLSVENVFKVNFTAFSFCSKTYITIPPFGTTGAVVNIIGLNFGPKPSATSTATVKITLSDGTTASYAPGVYFGTADPTTWVSATVMTWTPFYITAQVPLLNDRLVKVWVVKSGLTACISIKATNFFINTRYP